MKTIIFDFGNVVGFFDHGRTLQKLRPFTSWTPQEMYASVYTGSLVDELESGAVPVTEFLQHVHSLWQLRCDLAFLRQAIEDIFTANPEVCDLIPQLKSRYRLLLGSNTSAIHAEKFLVQFSEILSHFDALVMSHEIRVRKPKAEFFLQCHRLADAPLSECVFVDDLPDNIAGARSVGLHGIVYQPNCRLADQLRALGVEL